LADTKISDLVTKVIPEASDILPIVDMDVTQTKKATLGALWDAQDARFQSPDYSYDGDGLLSLITYSDGSTKTFTYALGKLSTIDFQIFGYSYIIRKTLIYLGDTLSRIDQTIV
jgi:hypothetical protein